MINVICNKTFIQSVSKVQVARVDESIVVKGDGSLPSAYMQIDQDLIVFWWSLFRIFLMTKHATVVIGKYILHDKNDVNG